MKTSDDTMDVALGSGAKMERNRGRNEMMTN